MEEEHWVIRSPLGPRIAIGRSSTVGAETDHISSHDKVRSTVQALQSPVRIYEGGGQSIAYLRTFNVGMETFKVAEETIQYEVVVGWS